jgi:hypothetical protein
VAGGSARLNAAVNPKSRETSYRFEYGLASGYGSATADGTVTPVNSAHRQVAATLSGLTPGATYHYRVVAENAAGTSAGEDRAFTAGTSMGAYAETIAGVPSLLSYWRLGETSDVFGYDEKRLELGTYTGGHALGEAGALTEDGDTSAGFDGVDGEMSATGPVVSTAATLEGWFLWQGGKTVLRDDSWAAGWILAYENSSGNLGYRVGDKIFSTGMPVAVARDGNWHHLAVTKDGSDAAIYLDGALLHSDVGATSSPSSGPWHVMRDGQHTDFAQGRADEVAIYDAALSAADVQRHYAVGLADTTPPDTTIDSGPSGTTTSPDVRFTFSSPESGTTFECQLDAGGWSECISPVAYSGLSPAVHTFEVRALDAVGNPDPDPARRAFTVEPPAAAPVDTSAPDTTIDSGPSDTTESRYATFGFSSTESDSTFECRLDGGGWGACSSPAEYSELLEGPHTFEARAIDAAGNADPSPASRAWSVARPPAPAPKPTRRIFAPRAYEVGAGRVIRPRGALRRLHRNDGNRLEVAGTRGRSRLHVADLFATWRVEKAQRASLDTLALTYDGGAAPRRASIAVRVYNFRRRRWVTIDVGSHRRDRTVRWSATASARHFVSSRGAVRIRVRATAKRPFRARTDLVRLAIEY